MIIVLGELHGVAERQPTGNEMILYQVEGPAREEICRGIEIASISSTELQGSIGKTVVGNVGERGRENCGFCRRVRRGLSMLVRVVTR